MTQQDDITQRVLTTEKRNEFIRRASFISECDRDTRAAFVDEIARAALASAPVAGEAQPVAHWIPSAKTFSTARVSPGKAWEPLYAAPQASAEDVRDTALRNLLWAASERDKGNRIRQFDQFMDEARAAISSNAAKQGSRDE